MDKNAIKKFAIWARKELIARVTQRAYLYGVTGEQALDAEQREVGGRLLSAVERKQRRTLVSRVKEKGFAAVMDEAAYTWFNRFAALRYMEVNGILPTRVRVFTNHEGAFAPQILADCLTMENLDGLNKELVLSLKERDATDELYKYLLITQCNALGAILPAMFEQIEDYTELLLPDNLLRQGSVIEQMVTTIPEDDWRDAVQIIGWLYQYYNSEPKDAVFAALKKNVKVSKENIPAATQLFTPDWIVRYMVENSLGRIWIEHNKANRTTGMILNSHTLLNSKATLNGKAGDEPSQYEKEFAEKMDWKYYLPEAKQEPDVAAELKKLRATRRDLAPTDIKVIDPCMGSGHILVYAFDVLVQIYKDASYPERSIPELILQHNLYGLDIDDRAYQLAYFAVMMRAWHYNHRILRKHIEPNLCAIQESNGLKKWSDATTDMSGNQLTLENQFIELADYLIDTFQDAKEYGSILTVKEANYDGLLDYIDEIQQHGASDLAVSAWIGEIADRLPALIKQAKIMSGKYDVCATNPPYMGSNGMEKNLLTYIRKNYPNEKSDFYSTFINKCIDFLSRIGYSAMMTSYTWMFLSSYKKLRYNLLKNNSIITLVQPEYHSLFEEANVPICSFVISKFYTNYRGEYIRLEQIKGSDKQEGGFLFAVKNIDCGYRYRVEQNNFLNIPDTPISYWLSSKIFNEFNYLLSSAADLKQGLITGNNDTFLRWWHECDKRKISINSPQKWYFYHKGGIYRKWYGNIDLVVNWENNGFDIINFKDERGKQRSRPQNVRYYFREGFTWTALTIADFNVRYLPQNSIFDAKGSSGFPKKSENLTYIIALCNSKVSNHFLSVLSPTMDYNAGVIAKLPYIESNAFKKTISKITHDNGSL